MSLLEEGRRMLEMERAKQARTAEERQAAKREAQGRMLDDFLNITGWDEDDRQVIHGDVISIVDHFALHAESRGGIYVRYLFCDACGDRLGPFPTSGNGQIYLHKDVDALWMARIYERHTYMHKTGEDDGVPYCKPKVKGDDGEGE